MSVEKNPALPLIKLLDGWGIQSEDDTKSIIDWPPDQIEELIGAFNDAVTQANTNSIQSAHASNSPFNSYPISPGRCSRSLLNRCMLYSDLIAVPVDRVAGPDQLTDFGVTHQLTQAINSLLELLPYLNTGLFLPVADYTPYVEDLSGKAEKVVEIANDPDVQALVAQHAQVGCLVESKKVTSEDGVEGTATIKRTIARFDNSLVSSVSLNSTVKAKVMIPLIGPEVAAPLVSSQVVEEDENLRSLRDQVVQSRIRKLLGDLELAGALNGASIVTNSPIAWELIDIVERNSGRTCQYPEERALVELDLPFLDEIHPTIIAEQRERLADSLEPFRLALHTLSIEAPEVVGRPDQARALAALREKHVIAPLRELRRHFASSAKDAFTEGVVKAITTGSVMSMAFYSPTKELGTVLAASAILAGGHALSKTVASQKRRAGERTRSSVYLLWKIERRRNTR